jgi:prepilin-type N-terminal cleavage/methylation domain-containing protein
VGRLYVPEGELAHPWLGAGKAPRYNHSVSILEEEFIMRKSNKGFTLVELIVVIGVLALLAVGAVLAFTNVQRNARIAAANSDAARLADALNTFNSNAATGARIRDAAGIAAAIPAASPTRVNLPISMTGTGLDDMDMSVSFGNVARLNLVRSWIEYTGDATTDGLWVVRDIDDGVTPGAAGGGFA